MNFENESGNRHERLDRRSPEVHEILGRTSGKFERWGISAILFLLLSILAISWFIKYPDILNAKVIITTGPPPVAIVSRSNGNLRLLKKENERVEKGEMVAYLISNASLDAVLYIENQLKNENNTFSNISPGALGDLQPPYASLVSSCTALNELLKNRMYDKQIHQIQKQIGTYQRLESSLRNQRTIAKQELILAKEKFNIDSALFGKKITSLVDFNQSKTNWLQLQRNALNTETSLLNNETQINLLQKQIEDIEVQRNEQHLKAELAVNQAKEQLLAQINKWKEQYVFIVPCGGNLAYLGFLEDQQFITINKSLFSVIPDNGRIIAHAELPLYGSGKVKEGQEVNIRLDNYPFEQFGMLRGKISSISPLYGEDKYWVTIDLPSQLLTSQKKLLPFKQQLTGNTEIITDNFRLLERFFQQFRKLLKARG